MEQKNRQNSLPQGTQLTALDEAFRIDPYQVLADVRAHTPAHFDQVFRRFIVTRHDDVKALLHDKNMFMDPRKANPGTFSREVIANSAGFASGEPDMLFLDDPDHHRLRSLVSGSFTPKATERWRPAIRQLVEACLDAIGEAEFDLIARFATPIPVMVIARMLGLDEQHLDDFKRWSDLVVTTGFNPAPSADEAQQAVAANEALQQFFLQQIALRKQQPGDDLISEMIRAELEDDRLTDQEIARQCRLLLIAGNVTTTDLIGNGVKALLDHPQQMQKLRDDPTLIRQAVEELLRFDGSVTNTSRVANRDLSVAGCPVGRGESLHLSLAAANRDPGVYDNPDKFDIERADHHHQAFGGGKHICLGAHLARIETQEALLGLLRRYPLLSYSERGYRYHSLPSFRGMSEFWIKTS